jgi:hypothetical protein
MTTYREILEEFKQHQNMENVAPLFDDPVLRRTLLVWPNVAISPTSTSMSVLMDMKYDGDDGDLEKWRWLWAHVKIDPYDVSLKSGLKVQEAQSVIEQLKALQLVYPDNTVNRSASVYIRSRVNVEITRLQKASRSNSNAN